MKRTFIFLLALALALGLCLVMLTPVAASPGTTYYVATTGSDESGTGSWWSPWKTIQHAVGQASSGDTIIMAPGIYVESPEIVIDKNLSIIGAGSVTTTIKPSGDTASNGAMFLINPGITLHISDVTLDGTGKKIWYALKYKGGGSVTDCDFKNIQYNPSGPEYQGIAICAYGEAYDDTIDFDDNVDIAGCTFTGIGRVGVLYFGPGITDSTYSDNTYVGKGDGDWLDYALDVGSGPNVTIIGSTISDCTGVASSDGSTSAGIMVTDLYKDYCPAYSGTEATITDNDISGCTSGVAVGYDETDLSIAAVSGNTFENNRYQIDCTPNVDVDLEATLTSNTFDRSVVVHGSGIKVPTIFSRIQDAIDAASAGDTINVYPGTYDQDEANDRDLYNGGAGSTDLNIFVDKSVTIQGVDEDGNPITDADDVQAFIVPERDTPLSNLSTIFIQADNVTIAGLDVTAYDDPEYNFKTISIIGDNAIIKDCKLHARDQVSSIYMYDPRYNSTTDTSYIQSYTFEDNYLDAGDIDASGIRISGGPGWSGDVANRIISGNTFDWGSYGIEFVGPGGDSWDVYPVGAATITSNSFSGQDRGSVVAWGKYKGAVGYGDLDWDSIFSNNTFDKSVIVKTSGGDVRYYDTYYNDGKDHYFYYVRGIYSAIQRYPINTVAQAGDTIFVGPGTYDEQVVITKSLTLQGTGDTTIIQPSSAAKLTQVFTGLVWSGGTKNIAGIVVANVSDGSPVTVKNLKVDESLITTKPAGADYLTGIFYRETGGIVDTVSIVGGGNWSGWDRAYGIYLSAETNAVSVEVKGSDISNWDKNGMEVMGSKLTANIHNNILTGRGPLPSDDEVQNGVDVGSGATATVNDNTISDLCWTAQQWWSYGIIFGSANDCSANGNNITDCQAGIIFDNNNGSAQGNTINGGTVGLTGLWAQYYASGVWNISFMGNTVTSANDDTYYEYQNAAIGVQSWDDGASVNATISSNQLTSNAGTSADGISIGDFPENEPAGNIKVTITGNNVSSWQEGIRLISSVASGSVITSNTITDNVADGSGIHIETGTNAANIVAHFNNIEGNEDYGIYNGGTGTLDATGNWWGDASGPYQATTNPSGTGDAASDNVDYSPWWGANYIEVAHPWTWYTNDSIQEAVDDASAGDTVNVLPGMYTGFEVTKDNLTIQGPTSAVVCGAAAGRDAVVYVGSDVDSITIQGLTINAAGVLHGIRATESGTYSSIAILGSTINDFVKSGIVANYASTVQLEDNIISTTDHSQAPNGIQIGESATGTTGTIKGNQISGCHWDGYDPVTETYEDEWTGSGILVIDDNSALDISDNEVRDCDVGMDIESGTPTTITNNDVHDNSYGFVLWNAVPTINYDSIYQNGQFGVYRTAMGDLTGTVDATYNWWGDASGPYHAMLNPDGECNAVSDNVNFKPWFGDEEMTILEPPSTYKFVYEVPELIVAGEEVVVPVTFETDELGYIGYDGVRFSFNASGPGNVTFKATDSEEHEYTFLNSGYWGPASGFPLPADYSATTDWTLNFSEPGEYTISFSLIEAPDGEVIAGIEGSQIVTVRAVDIMDYYRHLSEPYDEITSLELLAAIDDWIADVVPPGFEEPISSLELLALIDEWLAS
jgi:hypothetical protein